MNVREILNRVKVKQDLGALQSLVDHQIVEVKIHFFGSGGIEFPGPVSVGGTKIYRIRFKSG